LTMTQQMKSHNFCSVFGCNSRYSTCEGISFHQFPKDNEIKIMWLNKLGVEELVDKRRIWAKNLRMDKKLYKKRDFKYSPKRLDLSSITSHHNVKSTSPPSVETINDHDQHQIENVQRILKYKYDKEVQVSVGDIFVLFINLLILKKIYNNYKSTFTLKFLIGISPGSLITFISEPFGGQASDKAIFEQSGLMNKLEHPNAIMVDKGFMIDDLCKQKTNEIIRPPFLKTKNSFPWMKRYGVETLQVQEFILRR
ncbi:THAP-type domain-containing protein, partial [Aphis craccivora]